MTIILAFALSFNGSDRIGVAPDKIKHFFLSAFTQSAAYSAARFVRLEHDDALVAASVVTLGAGVGKEVADQRAGRRFDMADLAWDIAGGAAASVVLAQTRP